MTDFQVLLFASLKDAARADRITVVLPAHATVADLLRECAAQHPVLARYLPHVRVAVNCEYARADTLLGAGEIALLPPVAGG